MHMKTLSYSVRFNTPAFLGNAEQSGQWRTPPFKALLRQWWRVAYAGENRFQVDVAAMRKVEARLFGSAADSSGNRSLIRMRLDRWERGQMHQWGEDPKVKHPEVGEHGAMIGAHLYLGFGPLNFNKGTFLGKKDGLNFKPNVAIQAGDSACLRLAFPEEDAGLLDMALALMAHYGTVGGRSRNGWGSFSLAPVDGTPEPRGVAPQRAWRDALGLDWPHAIGRDERGALIWQTQTHQDWRALMRELAEIKIKLRTQFPFTTGNNAPRPEDRHWLSHPVTHHNVGPWRQARLPNSLRFKVRSAPEGGLAGVIFHVPCLPPREFRPDSRAIEGVWSRVHRHLDGAGLQRIPA